MSVSRLPRPSLLQSEQASPAHYLSVPTILLCPGWPVPVWLCGAFGETNKTFNKIIGIIAQHAEKTYYGHTISPISINSKHGAKAILKNQVCQGKHLQLVGSTHEEATPAGTTTTLADCSPWFTQHCNTGNYQSWYDEFHQSGHQNSRESGPTHAL